MTQTHIGVVSRSGSILRLRSLVAIGLAALVLHLGFAWLWSSEGVVGPQSTGWVLGHLLWAGAELLAGLGAYALVQRDRRQIVRKVETTAEELDRRRRAMGLILAHADQGLVVLDRDTRIRPGWSARLETWLGVPEAEQTFTDYLAAHNDIFALTFAQTWEQCLEDILPLDMALGQAPTELTVGGRELSFTFTPIMDDADRLSGLLVTVQDRTDDHERLRLMGDQADITALLDAFAKDDEGTKEFFREVRPLIIRLMTWEFGYSDGLRRALHTVKGAARTVGAKNLATLCHEIETTIATAGVPSAPQIAALERSWRLLESRMAPLMDFEGREGRVVSQAQLDRLLRVARGGAAFEHLAQAIHEIQLEPTRVPLRRLAAQARQIATDLGRGKIAVTVEDSGLRLDPTQWSTFWIASSHVIRNAVDHGLKPEGINPADEPTLVLSTYVDQRELVIAFSDNGAGIDWEVVKARARERGLPATSREDLKLALFAEGFSTAEEITEYSGRGVGLAAVLEECRARRGRVAIVTGPREGTSFQFRFPAEKAGLPVDEPARDHPKVRAS